MCRIPRSNKIDYYRYNNIFKVFIIDFRLQSPGIQPFSAYVNNKVSEVSVMTWLFLLSHHLYFFSFLFSFYLDLLHKKEVWEILKCHCYISKMSHGNVT